MATHVGYNGIEIHNCMTRQWDQRVVYDPSGADVERHEFSLTFEGLVHAGSIRTDQGTWVDAIGARGETTGINVSLYDYVQRRLMQPRKTLEVVLTSGEVAGESGPSARNRMLYVVPGTEEAMGQDSDVDQGPKPQSVSITQIVADRLFRVRFTIKCSILQCVNEATAVPYMISNRWSTSETMDDNFFTTVTIRGRMKVSEPFSSPLSAKGLIIPRLNPGFRRTSVMIATSPDGMEAEYEITDRQTHTAAPFPATKISGSYTESTGQGVLWYGQCSVRLEGSPESNRGDLLILANRIVDAKLRLSQTGEGVGYGKSYLVENYSLTENIGVANSVAIDVRIQHFLNKTEENYAAFLGSLRAGMGRPLEVEAVGGPDIYNPTVSRFPALYGYDPHGDIRAPAGMYALVCAMHDPCSPNKSYAYSVPASPGEDPEVPESTDVSVEESTALPTAPYEEQYDQSHKDAIYTHYEISSRYGRNECKVQLPIADPDLDERKPTSVVATLCRPQATREITLSASRVGEWPEIPEPVATYKDGDITATLLKHWSVPAAQRATNEGGQKVYGIEAFYEYALDRPPLSTEAVKVGINAYLSGTQDENKLTQADIYNERLSP